MVASNNDPTYGSLVKTKEDGSGLSIEQVENRDLTCAFFARQEIMQIVSRLPPSVICLYSGENDLDCISSGFDDKHAILDTTLNPAYRQVMGHMEEYSVEGLELPVSPMDLLSLRSIQNEKLFSAWVTAVKPSREEITEMETGAHGAANDAIMTYQLSRVLYDYRIKHGDVFDLLAPLDIDIEMYNRILRLAFDQATGGPVGVKKNGEMAKRIRQHLKHPDFHATMCWHGRQPHSTKGNRPASPVM